MKGGEKIQRKLKIVLVNPDELPIVKEIPNTLKAKQNEVSGLIEYLRIDDNALIICNEEGKINGMSPNRKVGEDVVFGSFFIVGDDPNFGEDRSLTEEQIKKYTDRFNKESITETKEYLSNIFGYQKN